LSPPDSPAYSPTSSDELPDAVVDELNELALMDEGLLAKDGAIPNANANAANAVQASGSGGDSTSWLRDVQALLKDNEDIFTGELKSNETSDLESAATRFEYQLNFIAEVANVPANKLNVIAMQLLGGRAKQNAIDLARRSNPPVTIPALDSIISLVRQMATGSAIGPVTRTERLFKYCLKDLAVHTYRQNGEIPDIHYCIGLIRKELEKRTPMDQETLVFFWVHMCRNLPILREIICTCTSNGVQVEQTDPAAVVQSLQALNYKFRPLIEEAVRHTTSNFKPNTNQNQNRNSGAGPSSRAGPSDAFKLVGNKRKHVDKKPKNTTEDFNPFKSLPASSLSATPQNKSAKPWILGSTNQDRQALTAKSLCWLCKKSGHPLVKCNLAPTLFKDRKFCWYLPNA